MLENENINEAKTPQLNIGAVSGRSEQLVCRLHTMRKNCREYRYNKKYCKKCPHNVRQTNCH